MNFREGQKVRIDYDDETPYRSYHGEGRFIRGTRDCNGPLFLVTIADSDECFFPPECVKKIGKAKP